MDTSSQYFVHNGYLGWSYGTPSDPQSITVEDAARIMVAAGLSADQVSYACPAAQYATMGDKLNRLTGGNRFLFYGPLTSCADINQSKVTAPLVMDWDSA